MRGAGNTRTSKNAAAENAPQRLFSLGPKPGSAGNQWLSGKKKSREDKSRNGFIRRGDLLGRKGSVFRGIDWNIYVLFMSNVGSEIGDNTDSLKEERSLSIFLILVTLVFVFWRKT